MKTLTLRFATVIAMMMAFTTMNAQEKKTLESDNMLIWDNPSTSGRVKLCAAVSERDTTFTLGFDIHDAENSIKVNKGDKLILFFDDGDTIKLNCVSSNGLEQPFRPVYGISRNQLLKIVGKRVFNLTFNAGEQIYPIDIKGRRFSNTIGKECASLCGKGKRKAKNVDDTDLTTEMLFGDAQLRRPSIHWNRHYGISLGYSRLHDAFEFEHIYRSTAGNGDSHFFQGYKGKSKQGMVSVDFLLKGVYLGVSTGKNDIGRLSGWGGRDDDFRCYWWTVKIGPALSYGTARKWITVAPYTGVLLEKVRRNGNFEDQHKRFLFGLRASYNIKHFEIGGNYSTEEAGVFVGYHL